MEEDRKRKKYESRKVIDKKIQNRDRRKDVLETYRGTKRVIEN